MRVESTTIEAPVPSPDHCQNERGARPLISVVLSFFNEAAVLPELIDRLRATLRKEVSNGHASGYELVFVNDASTDESEQILRKEADEGRDILIVNMSHNFGVSPCVIAGMAYSRGELVVYMDSDLQDPPELISEMLALWRSEPDVDVVNTVRRTRQGDTWLQLNLTRIGYKILRRISDVQILENAGDFKLLSRRVVNHMVRMNEKLPFIRGMVYWIGYKQLSLSYDRVARFDGRSKFPILGRKVLQNFLFSAMISFSSAPLMLTIALGLLTSLFSFVMLVYVVVQWFVLREVTQGWTMLMATMTLLGGMQLLTNGINGLYINTIYHETKRRPPYIVSSVYGFDANRKGQ